MKILVTGGSGVVGSAFLKLFSSSGNQIINPTHKELDITEKADLVKFFKEFKPDYLLHFAAFRDAGLAETERGKQKGKVWITNVEAVKNIVDLSNKFKTHLIYLSTDMIFPGTEEEPGPYDEEYPLAKDLKKLSWYGWSKLNAEEYIRQHLKKTTIIRIGNVTIPSVIPKQDYIGKIFTYLIQDNLYPLFDNQYLTLTFIPQMKEAIEKVIKDDISGTFHISTSNLFTPLDLAKYLSKNVNKNAAIIKGTTIDKYLENYPYRYPKFGGLKNEKTFKKLNLKSMRWEEVVDIFIKSVNNTNIR